MSGLLMLLLVLFGLLVVIAIGSRLLAMVVPRRRAQERRFRAVATTLGGRFGRSLIVADPDLRLWLHGQPVFVTSSFGKYGHEISSVRLGALEGCSWPGVSLELEPGRPVEHEHLGEDGLAAAAALAALVGHPCSVQIRQQLWGDQGFAELLCGGYLTDHDDGAVRVARSVVLLQRMAFDLRPVGGAGE